MTKTREPRTPRELADSKIAECQRALDAIRFGGKANAAVVRDQRDKWLEYRHDAMKDGTLDKPRPRL